MTSARARAASKAAPLRAPPLCLNFRSFGYGQSILDVDTKVANSAFNLGMTEKYLHGSQVAGLLIDDRSLGPSKGMRSVILFPKANPRHPLIDKARILPRA